jgi:hypothetical protein
MAWAVEEARAMARKIRTTAALENIFFYSLGVKSSECPDDEKTGGNERIESVDNEKIDTRSLKRVEAHWAARLKKWGVQRRIDMSLSMRGDYKEGLSVSGPEWPLSGDSIVTFV